MLYIVCLHHCMYVSYMFIKYQSIMYVMVVAYQRLHRTCRAKNNETRNAWKNLALTPRHNSVAL